MSVCQKEHCDRDFAKLEAERDEWKRLAHVEAKGLRCAFRARAEAAEAEVARLTNKLNADSQNFEIECLLAEVERLKHLIFVWRQASYSGTPDEYQRAAVDLEDEALRPALAPAQPEEGKR